MMVIETAACRLGGHLFITQLKRHQLVKWVFKSLYQAGQYKAPPVIKINLCVFTLKAWTAISPPQQRIHTEQERSLLLLATSLMSGPSRH